MSDFFAAHLATVVYGVFALVTLLIIWAVVGAILGSRRRRSNIKEWAFRHGYQYFDGPMPATELAPMKAVTPDGKLIRADASNIAQGRVTLFDLTMTTRSQFGRRRANQDSTKTMSCAIFKLAEPLPRFQFSAVTAADSGMQSTMMGMVKSLAALVADTHDMIPIESRPGYLLRGEEAERIKPLFTDERVKFFDDKCGWSVEVDGTCLMVSCDPAMYEHGWERSTVVDEKNYDDFVRISQQVYDHFLHSSS